MVHVHRINRGVYRLTANTTANTENQFPWSTGNERRHQNGATGTAAHQKRCPCNRGPQWQFLLGLLVCWTWRKANFHFATRLSWPFNKHKCKYLQITSNDIHCNQRSTGNVGKAAKLGSFSWVVGDWCALQTWFSRRQKNNSISTSMKRVANASFRFLM